MYQLIHRLVARGFLNTVTTIAREPIWGVRFFGFCRQRHLIEGWVVGFWAGFEIRFQSPGQSQRRGRAEESLRLAWHKLAGGDDSNPDNLIGKK
jgi:hypothetical protein